MMIRFLIVLGIMGTLGIGICSVSIAAEKSDGLAEEPVAAPQQNQPEPVEGPLRRRLLGATPEERARLDAERKRLSREAASFGVDPTAIIGYYQVVYGHSVLTNDVRIDSAAATIRLPMTPNWAFQVTMPYAWADLNNSSAFPLRGAGDMTARTGGRIFSNKDVAVFVGLDALFPTASEKQLGTGKYTLGPGGALAVPLPRMRSQFNVVALDYNSVGGDPSRTNLHYMQVQPAVYTFWTEQWLTGAVITWDVDWNNGRKNTVNLLGQVGYRFTKQWVLFGGPGVGVAGKDTPLGLDWTVQAGLRWVYATPLLPETLFGSMPMK